MRGELPDQVKDLFKTFKDAGFQLYLVGGAVRDLLLPRPVKDWDFTTDATPEQIIKVVPGAFYNNKYGTVGLAGSLFEITTMRKEGIYKDGRRPESVSWTDKIEEDLARRDFTLNAMAVYISDDGELQLIDPFQGQKAINGRYIKAVGDPNLRFREDSLRLMRAIRFTAQLDMSIEQETYSAISKNAHLINNISAERIRDELFKILSSPSPLTGLSYLNLVGLATFVFPELNLEGDFPSFHLCFYQDHLVRLACLLHQTSGETGARAIANRLKFSNKDKDFLLKLVESHML